MRDIGEESGWETSKEESQEVRPGAGREGSWPGWREERDTMEDLLWAVSPIGARERGRLELGCQKYSKLCMPCINDQTYKGLKLKLLIVRQN